MGTNTTGLLSEVQATSIGPADEVTSSSSSSSSSSLLAPQPLPWGGKPCAAGRGCLPSFLIIGAGKAGTSSLYYYLQEHPHVEAAAEKQVQFFDHQYSRGLDWYRSRFPRRMANGHVTGEASPGYIVYSRVPPLVLASAPEARIVALVREPLDRFWSSYHYNYLDVLAMMNDHPHHHGGRRSSSSSPSSSSSSSSSAFSSGVSHRVVAGPEHFVNVEIEILQACLAERGYSPRVGTGFSPAADGDRSSTDSGGSGGSGGGASSVAPLDVTAACINTISTTSHLNRIRASVAKAAGKSTASTRKVHKSIEVQFPITNSHLFRQFVSRGLYSLMLEHWFHVFPPNQIAVVCTETLAAAAAAAVDPAASSSSSSPSSSSSSSVASLPSLGGASPSGAALTVSRVAAFIGLEPSLAGYFEAAVAKGKFNAAAQRGYEKVGR